MYTGFLWIDAGLTRVTIHRVALPGLLVTAKIEMHPVRSRKLYVPRFPLNVDLKVVD